MIFDEGGGGVENFKGRKFGISYQIKSPTTTKASYAPPCFGDTAVPVANWGGGGTVSQALATTKFYLHPIT